MRIIPLACLELPGRLDLASAFDATAQDPSPIQARKGRMLLDLVRLLESRGPAASVFGLVAGEELWLLPDNRHNRSRTRVDIRVDWFDHAPIRDGLPEMHYRLSIRRPGSALSRDERATDLNRVAECIERAFGWFPGGSNDESA